MVQDNNLNQLASKIAFELINEKILEENDINKLLGILSRDGVYAMWVWALDKLGVKFYENKEKLKNERIFKFLYEISKLDKFISKSLNFDQLVENIANLTQEINNLNEEIKSLNEEIKVLKINNRRNTNREEINEKEREKEEKINEKKSKEKERNEKLTKYFINVAQDIHKLLFLKQILEKVLIYARYHAKAKSD